VDPHRRSYDIDVSEEVLRELRTVIDELDRLIGERDTQVEAAMASFTATGVSDQYHGEELRWRNAAHEVRDIIGLIRTTLDNNNATAAAALQKAKQVVERIGTSVPS
jgi:hypothetical protein